MTEKKIHPTIKLKLHPRNKHRSRYDFKPLVEAFPELAQFVHLNKYDDESIDFANPLAVLMLNKALLKYYYKIETWNIPEKYLCPPIPGRADYIHHISDLLASFNNSKLPFGNSIKCLDIGVGANCVYPIIGTSEYEWLFIGSDIDLISIDSANTIVKSNKALQGKIELRLQNNSKNIFRGIIKKDEFIDISICNPPFHSSYAEAQDGTNRKNRNLSKNKQSNSGLNFGGKSNELWCEGGEIQFIKNMINESFEFSQSCFLFSTLVSKQSNLKYIYQELEKVKASFIKTISMGQGNKVSRIVAWTFLNKNEQQKWISSRWI